MQCSFHHNAILDNDNIVEAVAEGVDLVHAADVCGPSCVAIPRAELFMSSFWRLDGLPAARRSQSSEFLLHAAAMPTES